MDFYQHLNFSIGNEDWRVESQALRVKPQDKVICVTASGDRALHLLMTECAEVIAIDLNPSQNFLLELKLAAISHLDFETYLAFLGCEATPHRQSIFYQLRRHLSSSAAAFWMQHPKMIEKGIIYQGRVERLTRAAAAFFKLVRGNKLKTLFAFDDIHEQRLFVTQHWDNYFLRKIFEFLIKPSFLKNVFNDPGLNSFVEYAKKPSHYIYQRMLDCLHEHLAKKSALFQLVFYGKLLPEAYFSYLTPEGYHAIRRDPSRLHYQTANIIEFLHDDKNQGIDCFSLSDIASYMPQAAFEKLLSGMKQAANPNARFCIREFMSKRIIPAEFAAHFKRDAILESKLEKEETNFVYRFMAGEICHGLV